MEKEARGNNKNPHRELSGNSLKLKAGCISSYLCSENNTHTALRLILLVRTPAPTPLHSDLLPESFIPDRRVEGPLLLKRRLLGRLCSLERLAENMLGGEVSENPLIEHARPRSSHVFPVHEDPSASAAMAFIESLVGYN